MKKTVFLFLLFVPSLFSMEKIWHPDAQSAITCMAPDYHAIKQEIKPFKEIRRAVKSGNIEALEQFIAQGNEVDSHRYLGLPYKKTLLMLACQHDQPKICSLLIAAGANVNAKDHEEIPPLMHVSKANGELYKVLIDAGANVNAQDLIEETPLMHASILGNLEGCRLLLDAGAHPNDQDIEGYTALLYATEQEELACIDLLIKYGASIHLKSLWGSNPLLNAAHHENKSLCRFFVQTQKNHCRGILTALLFLKHAKTECSTLLYRHRDVLLKPWLEGSTLKALLNARDYAQRSAYDFLRISWLQPFQGDSWQSKKKKKKKNRIRTINKALSYAAQLGDAAEVKRCLWLGADVNTRSVMGEYDVFQAYKTPLMVATEEGNTDVCKILIAAGAKEIKDERFDLFG